MKLVKGTLMGIGAIALIASLMSIVAPKAVHAAVAALVQVANTPTTAVPTVAAPAASQLYASTCTAGFPNSPEAVCSFAPPPAGQTLFIESASIWSTTNGYYPIFALIDNGSGNPINIPMVQQANFPGPAENSVGTLAGRIWVKAGVTPQCNVGLAAPPSGGGLTCVIIGYLAAAQ